MNTKLILSLFLAVTVTVAAALVSAQYPTQKQVPVIGILVSPMEECMPPPADVAAKNPIGCVESYYARWLEASAARIIPIPWNITTERLTYLFDRVNGFLFPGGGGLGAAFPKYFDTLSTIVDMTLAANKKGDPMFIWGTCFGFQMTIGAIAKNVSIITPGFKGMYPLMMPLNATGYFSNSVMYNSKTVPADIIEWLQTKPTTLNWHHAGITPEDWQASSLVTSTLRPLSTNTEPGGPKRFISSYEGINANIFATQYHPERPPVEFSNPGIGHTAEDIQVSQYLSRFAVSRAKLNSHSFETPEASEALILEKNPLVWQGWGMETYYILP